jgi:CDGSH-type Zn-finger protein
MPKLIQDEFTSLDVSDQRRYQLRREKRGLCRLCGSAVSPGKPYCQAHYERQLSYGRKARAAPNPMAVVSAEDII